MKTQEAWHGSNPIIFVTDHLYPTDINNTPMSGSEGQLLHNLLNQVGLRMNQHVTPLCLHSVQMKEEAWRRVSDEVKHERWTLLKAKLLSLPNKMIVTDSRFIVERIFNADINTTGLSHYHSTVIEWEGKWVIPIPHVQTTYQSDYLSMYTMHRDLLKINMIYKDPNWSMDLTKRSYNINPTISEFRNFCDMIREKGRFSFDIETTIIPDRPKWKQGGRDVYLDWDTYTKQAAQWRGYKHITCCSFSIDGKFGMCIPLETFIQEAREEDYINFWLEILRLLDDPKLVNVMQNASHEIVQVFQLMRISIKNKIEDTMIGHSILFPELPKGLDYLAASFTFLPYFKKGGKKKFLDFSLSNLENLYIYNATDACATMEVYDVMKPSIENSKFYNTYRDTIDSLPMLTFMELFGTNYDRESPKALGKIQEWKEKVYEAAFLWMADNKPINIRDLVATGGTELMETVEQLEAWYNETLDFYGPPTRDINLSSPQQLMGYFYDEKGITPYTKASKDKHGNRKSSKTIDDKALEKLSRPLANRAAIPEAILLRKYRTAKKNKSTYVDIMFGLDGRFHANWDPRGSGFSRLSSSSTIDKVGCNMQNIPYPMRKYYLPDPDHLWYSFDLKQAEWVYVAFDSQEEKMINAYLAGEDVHVNTAALITDLPHEFIQQEEKLYKEKGKKEEFLDEIRNKLCAEWGLNRSAYFFPRTMSLREMGKKANHSLNYGISSQAFAIDNEITNYEAGFIHNRYYGIYQGIGKWHRLIREEINQTGMLYNCFGRYNRFMNRKTEQYYKAGYAFRPQSAVGDIILKGMRAIWQEANYGTKEEQIFWKDTYFLANVHDSTDIERKNKGWDDAYRFILAMRDKLHQEITLHERTFTIGVDGKLSDKNWLYGIEFDAEMPQHILSIISPIFNKESVSVH